MKIIVIGKNGNLGRELLKTLPQATGWDRTEIDITHEAQVTSMLAEHRPDVVFNCAAFTNVDQAQSDYKAAELINGQAVGFLAKACHDINATLVHYSTGMVFKGDNPNGYNEDSTPDPVNAYGESKLLGEKLIAKHIQKYYLIRTEWLYAKPENKTAKKSFNEIILDLAKTNSSLVGVIDEIGKPTWANDLAQASFQLISRDYPYGIYHLTNEGQASRHDWAKEILKIKNIDIPLEAVEGKTFARPAPRPKYELLNNNKFPKLRSWQDALKEYLQTSE